MQSTATKIWVFIFLLSLVALFFYSFTQVDLGLSLSRFQGIYTVQRSFQEIGFFQRPQSALIFSVIVSTLCVSYLFLLRDAYRGILKTKAVIVLSIISVVILLFSYNAFSYDLFNYIFDAKIVTVYGENPYLKKALDFPGDPMLGFMRWTHRVYPYGPVWLAITIPLSYSSFGSFLVSLVFFKALMAFSYLGSVFLLNKIIKQLNLSNGSFHLALFALNPLVLVESLVSAHNDIFMLFLMLAAFYLLTVRKKLSSFALLLLSIGVKFATVFLLPLFAYVYLQKKIIDWQKVITYSFILMTVALIAVTFRTNFQPWYLLYIIPFAALSKKVSLVVPTLVLSLFAFLQYLPYIYTGNYDPPIPFILAGILSTSLLISCLVLVGFYFRKRVL